MSLQTSSRTGVSAEINITPMIDILLVLLIVFMVMKSFAPVGEDALIPQPPTQETSLPPPVQSIVVQLLVGHSGTTRLKINQDPVEWDELPARIHEIFKQRAEKVMFIKADADIEFSNIAQVIDIAHNDGIDSVGLITSRIENGL